MTTLKRTGLVQGETKTDRSLDRKLRGQTIDRRINPVQRNECGRCHCNWDTHFHCGLVTRLEHDCEASSRQSPTWVLQGGSSGCSRLFSVLFYLDRSLPRDSRDNEDEISCLDSKEHKSENRVVETFYE